MRSWSLGPTDACVPLRPYGTSGAPARFIYVAARSRKVTHVDP
jgi:hypothetical protein